MQRPDSPPPHLGLHSSPGAGPTAATTATNLLLQPYSYSFVVVLLVVGNVLSALFLSIVRFNTMLFADYTAEFVYAVLLSEALFAPRQRVVKTLIALQSEITWKPRQVLVDALWGARRTGRTTMVVLGTAFVLHSELGLIKTMAWVGLLLAAVSVVADSKVAYVFRIPLFVMSNESLAALIILVGLLVSLVTIVGVFLYLSLRDAAVALDTLGEALENAVNDLVLNNSGVRESVAGVVLDAGRITSYLNEQFEGSAFGPLVKSLTLSLLRHIEQSRQAMASSSTTAAAVGGDKTGPDNPFLMLTSTWDTLTRPDTWNWKALTESMSLDGVTQTLMKDSAQVKDVLKSASGVVFASVVVALSFLYALFDSVVRLLFSLTMLLFLLTSKESLSQVVIKSLRGIMTDPRDRANLEAFESELVHTFEACFVLPVAMSLLHGGCVLLVMGVFNVLGGAQVPAPFFASSLVALVTLFPFVSPSLVITVPWCTYAALQGKPWVSVMLALSITFMFWWIDDSILSSFSRHRRSVVPPPPMSPPAPHHHRQSQGHSHGVSVSPAPTARGVRRNSEDGDIVRRNAYLTGLSLFLGVTAFGLHGVVFGPLIVSFLLTSYNFTYNTARDASQRIWRKVTSSS